MNSGTIYSIVDFTKDTLTQYCACLLRAYHRGRKMAQNGALRKHDLLGHDFYCLFTSDNAEI